MTRIRFYYDVILRGGIRNVRCRNNWVVPDLVWQILDFRMFIEAMSKFIRIEITYIVETLVKMFRLNFEF